MVERAYIQNLFDDEKAFNSKLTDLLRRFHVHVFSVVKMLEMAPIARLADLKSRLKWPPVDFRQQKGNGLQH